MTINKTINGMRFKFDIKYQPKYKANKAERYFLKVIDCSVESVGFGPSSNWADALDFARELTQ